MELNTDVDNMPAKVGGEATVDMVLVLSSDLVCQIAEKYFNSTMLKKKVKVIDLKATSNGLVQFNVAFEAVPAAPLAVPTAALAAQRASNGRFRKVKDHE